MKCLEHFCWKFFFFQVLWGEMWHWGETRGYEELERGKKEPITYYGQDTGSAFLMHMILIFPIPTRQVLKSLGYI